MLVFFSMMSVILMLNVQSYSTAVGLEQIKHTTFQFVSDKTYKQGCLSWKTQWSMSSLERDLVTSIKYLALNFLHCWVYCSFLPSSGDIVHFSYISVQEQFTWRCWFLITDLWCASLSNNVCWWCHFFCRAPLKLLCDNMKYQIISRAFYGCMCEPTEYIFFVCFKLKSFKWHTKWWI